MRKLRKWEEEYMQYKNGEKHKEMQEIQTKLNNKLATKEEYDKLMKMKKIDNNIEKVSNILELKNQLENQIKEIEAEESRRQGREEKISEQNKQDEAIYKEAQTIQLELASIEDDKERVKAELKEKAKNNTLSADEEQALNQKLAELDNKIAENNKKYVKNFEAIKNIEKRVPEKQPVMRSNKFSGISNEELDKKKFELSTKISKCNMVAGNLMKGMNWDAIDVKLEKWQDKKFVSKDGKPLTKKATITLGVKDLNAVKEPKTEKDNQNQAIAKPDRIAQWMENNKAKHKWTYALLNKFYDKEKHPNIYKALNGLSKLGKEPEQEPQQQTSQESFKDKREDFNKYLKDVADKGLKTMQQEKLSKAKEQAVKREEEKFSKQGNVQNTQEPKNEKDDEDIEK